MSMSIRLRRIAQREFDDAADWYEQRQAGLGARFIDEIQQVLYAISQNPQQFAEVHADFRQALANRFPYAIYYKVESAQVTVLGVVHTSRDPSVWQSRA
jgi:plasmid stabilization system protein ParE